MAKQEAQICIVSSKEGRYALGGLVPWKDPQGILISMLSYTIPPENSEQRKSGDETQRYKGMFKSHVIHLHVHVLPSVNLTQPWSVTHSLMIYQLILQNFYARLEGHPQLAQSTARLGMKLRQKGENVLLRFVWGHHHPLLTGSVNPDFQILMRVEDALMATTPVSTCFNTCFNTFHASKNGFYSQTTWFLVLTSWFQHMFQDISIKKS